MKRREFVRYTATTAGVFSFTSIAKLFDFELEKKYANDIVILGKTGIKVSRLAIGTGTGGYNHRSNKTRNLGITGVSDLFRAAYDHGINFWDSADQ